MKKMRNLTPRNLIPLLVVFILSIVGVTTATAEKLGDSYSYLGIQIGWILIIAAIVLAFIFYYVLRTGPFKKTLPLIAILIGVGLLLALTDVAVEIEPAEITPGVTWSVTAAVSGGNITVDNDLNTVTILCHANDSTATNPSTMRGIDDEAFTQPVINFSISPSLDVGITDLDLGATTIAKVVNPDAAFTVSGTSYDLFADVAGTSSDKDLTWTADGTNEEEFHHCTVQFGTSEHVVLTPVYYQAGVAELGAGTIKSSTINIGGETWTMTLIVVVQNTA